MRKPYLSGCPKKLNTNAKCFIRKVLSYSMHGESRLGQPVGERCAIAVRRDEVAKTTVRADSSASRGYADEFLATNKILIDGKTVAKLGDQLEVAGAFIKILTMHQRYDTAGRVDHYEISGELWA